MSIKIMTEIWECGNRLNGSARMLMLAIADHANDDRVCWPSVPHLARKVCLTDRQVQRLLRSLEARGFISTFNRGDMKLSSVYRIADRQTLEELSSDKGDIQGDESMGDIQGTPRVTSRASMGDMAVSPEPSMNRQESSFTRAPKQTPRRKQEDAAEFAVVKHFTEISNRRPIGSDIYKRWRDPARNLLIACDWDVGKVNGGIEAAVKQMRKDGLTFDSVQSVMRVTASILAEQQPSVGIREW